MDDASVMGAGRDDADATDAMLGPDVSMGSPDGALASRWRTGPPLPVPLQEISAITLDERIWIVGGFEPDGDVGTVRILDPTTGTWSLGPSLPRPRHHVALAEVGGDLYVLGGMETSRFPARGATRRASSEPSTSRSPIRGSRGRARGGTARGSSASWT
jgi:hypothetical protein